MKKYKQLFVYITMGALTTVLNVAVFYICIEFLDIGYKMATTIAWLLSVMFAYITNKSYVFNSKTTGIVNVLKEMTSFFSFRLASYFIDLLLMIVLIDLFNFEATLSKIAVNILVVIFNYFVSKYYIFRQK